MSTYLKSKYSNVIETPDYIVAEGDIPIALVAHMDTVFPRPALNIYYDRVKNVIWSSEGLGADDRAGIFAIIQILRKGLRPHIILTTDEEKGACGAFALSEEKCPFKDLRFIIQLDRRGPNDCVFYDCDNKKFTSYIEDFGFVEAIGSFSDISVICPAWGIAGVNLSIGYEDEHSFIETLWVGHMFNTINKVTTILTQPIDKIPSFKYIASKRNASRWYRYTEQAAKNKEKNDNACYKCKKTLPQEELIDVKTCDFKWHQYCGDCVSSGVDWCVTCGEAYETPSEGHFIGMCEDCYYEYYYSRY